GPPTLCHARTRLGRANAALSWWTDVPYNKVGVVPALSDSHQLRPFCGGPLMRVQRASELEARACSWLWPGRLALGKLAILDGDPGLGKSLLALDLCARVSTGRPLPDGQPGPGPANVLVLEAE